MAYPDDIDSFTLREDDDLIPKGDYNGQNNSIVAIETELGTLPKGTKADVKTRLDDIDTAIGGITGKVDKAGDTMTGNLVMSGANILSNQNIETSGIVKTNEITVKSGTLLKILDLINTQLAIGLRASASGVRSLSIGQDSKAENTDSFAIGAFCQAKGNESFVLGYSSTVEGVNSLSLGSGTKCNGSNGVSIGRDVDCLQGSNLGLGSWLDVNNVGGVCIGQYLNSNADYAIVIGQGTGANELTNAVANSLKIGLNGAGGEISLSILLSGVINSIGITAFNIPSAVLDAGSYKVGGVAGASGSFTTVDLKTVTVVNGLITSIV